MAATILAWLVYGGVPRAAADGPSAGAPRAGRLRPRDRRPHRARREPLLKLSLVGISHHVAPVELRERVALPLERAAALARALGDAVCLSTCNRTEVYLAGERRRRARSRSLEELAGEPLRLRRLPDARRGRGRAPLPRLGRARLAGARRERDPRPGARGVRRRRARARCSTGCSARRSSSASACAPRPRSARARRRCPSAAAALAEQVFGDLDGPARAARRRRPDRRARRRQPLGARRRRSPTSRTAAPEAAADARGPLRRARRSRSTTSPSKLGEVDVVLASTSAPGLRRSRRATCRRAAASRCSSSTSPSRATSTRPCTSSTAASSTTSTTSRPSWPRRSPAAAPRPRRAERLVVEEAERFREWQASLDVVPAIASLRAHAEEIRAAELAKLRRLPERRARARSSR